MTKYFGSGIRLDHPIDQISYTKKIRPLDFFQSGIGPFLRNHDQNVVTQILKILKWLRINSNSHDSLKMFNLKRNAEVAAYLAIVEFRTLIGGIFGF